MVRKSITLKAWEDNKQTALAVQGEVGARWLDITLLDENIPLDLTNCFAVIYMNTGVVIYNYCEIVDAINGQISVELTQNMSGIYGDFEAEIHIYDELGNLLKIKGLEITIRKSTDVTVTVEARDEFTALQQALSTVGEYSGRIDTNVTDILTNAENIAENREDIDENRTDIDTNTRNIQTLNANKADKTTVETLQNDVVEITDTANKTYSFSPYENEQIFTSSGGWTCPDGVTNIAVWIVDGGTGGAGSYQPKLSDYRQTWVYVPYSGSGKMGLIRNISVTPGQSYSVVVGMGGAGGSVDSSDYSSTSSVVQEGDIGGISSFNGIIATNAIPREQGYYPSSGTAQGEYMSESGDNSPLSSSRTERPNFSNILLTTEGDVYLPLSYNVVKETYGAGVEGMCNRWQNDDDSAISKGDNGKQGRVIIYY